MPRIGHPGLPHPVTRPGVRILSYTGGYPVPNKNITQLTPTGNPDYYAFGNPVRFSNDSMMYIAKRGSDHITGVDLFRMSYTASTNTWGSPASVATTGSSDIYSGVSFGKIGSHLYVFVSKYNEGSDLFTDSGYIKSTDLTGTSWGSYQSITAPPYERYESYGKFHESVTTPGKFFTTRFSHKDGGTDPWCLEVIKITSDGATWTPIEVYDGAVKYSEMALLNVGGSTWIGLARKFETNGVFGLFRSTNDCEAWTLLGDTNLGAGPGNADMIYHDGLIHVILQNRATGFVQISKNNVLSSVVSLTFNTPTNYQSNGTGDSLNGLGYPSIILLREPDVVYLTYAKESSTSEAHIYGTLDTIGTM